MKRFLLIFGVIIIFACIIMTVLAALNLHACRNLRDGTPQHYDLLHNRAITLFWVGLALALIGAGCIVWAMRL